MTRRKAPSSEPPPAECLQDRADRLVAPALRRCRPAAPGRSGTGRSAGRSPAGRWSAACLPAPRRAATSPCSGSIGAERQVLRHALDEPERRIDRDHRLHAGAGPAPAQMSYWNWCAISCWSTCSQSSYEPVNGRTMRCLQKSVKPPVPSLGDFAARCWSAGSRSARRRG